MRTSTRRPRPVTDDGALATRIGGRLKEARLRAKLTQQQLAGERYTKAYVSALENGLVRPSMAALNFFAGQLGTSPSRLIGDEAPAWSRLEADVHLAAGRWTEAVDGFSNLLDGPTDSGTRAELLRGRAEANARLDNPVPASADAAEAVRLFTAAGRASDAALATYWLAYAHYKQDNLAEARSLMREILDRVRNGLKVEPDYHLRLLMALSSIESRDGDQVKSLAYLQEVRAIADTLDDRRRGNYLLDLAYAYRETGDMEAAIRAGMQGLALFRASGAEFEMAILENNLALAFLGNGSVNRAGELAASARARLERLNDQRWLAHVDDTEAQIALGAGNPARALELAAGARERATQVNNEGALARAFETSARAHVELGQMDAALGEFEEAAKLARQLGMKGMLREILGRWADLLARQGQHEQAYALTREALSAS